MGFGYFLLMLFVLTPISAIQTGAAATFLAFMNGNFQAADGNNIWPMIICAVVVLVANHISDLIRYGEQPSILLFLTDIPLSIVRLPLQVISIVLGVIGMDIDPRSKPSLDFDAPKDFFLKHYLQLSISSDYYFKKQRKEKERERKFAASSDPSVYKGQNIGWQLGLWIQSFLHSICFFVPLYSFLNYVLPNDLPEWVDIVAFIVMIIFYLFMCMITASKKGFYLADEWYDNTEVTEVSYEWKNHIKNWERKERVVSEPGWRIEFTPMMFFYWFTGWIWVIPQTVTLILAIIIPAGARVLPCRAVDVDFRRVGLGNRIIHALFGVIIT